MEFDLNSERIVHSFDQSVQVSQGLTALTFWVLVHFLFIFGAIIVYGVQLTLIRSKSHCLQGVIPHLHKVRLGEIQPS